MAVIISTNTPDELRDAFVKGINDSVISTWLVDEEGDFTIRRELWRNHAWMRYQRINDHSAAFGIVESRKYPMTKDLYGIMHGRFVATLLTHFDSMIENVIITSQLDSNYDVFNPDKPDKDK